MKKYYILNINPLNKMSFEYLSGNRISYLCPTNYEVKKGDLILGYIGNPVNQIKIIFESDSDYVDGKLFVRKIIETNTGLDLQNISYTNYPGIPINEGEYLFEISEEIFLNIQRELIEKLINILKGEITVSSDYRSEFEGYLKNEKKLRFWKAYSNELKRWSDYMVDDKIILSGIYSLIEKNDIQEFDNKLKGYEKFIKWRKETKEKTPNSGLQIEAAITNYYKFSESYLAEQNNAIGALAINRGNEIKYKTGISIGNNCYNRILFGAPGTGKSYTINKDKDELLVNGGGFERVTFYPDYSYAGFVGTYKPVSEKDEETNKYEISYKFVPGPFMRTLVKALESGRSLDPKPYLLLIEEINRANVAAVFGDVFQLLDRKDGISEYAIQASEDIKEYLAEKLGGEPDNYETIRIPDNMLIWATMNSADQGVFPMDTAFKRRWDFTYLGINDAENDIIDKVVRLPGEENSIAWNSIRKGINSKMVALKINEDKQLGPYFINVDNIIEDEETNELNADEFIRIFKNKVLMYLFEDAVKQRRSDIFGGCEDSHRQVYSEICKEFDAKGIDIFSSDITNAIEEYENQRGEK